MRCSPVFIVGSGRNGSELFYRLLGEFNNVESHHEYMIHQVQPLACKFHMQLIDPMEALWRTREIYRPPIVYARKELWVNSCNKASWLIKQIDTALNENVRFLHVLRNGRRVVSSYYNKLSNECYNDADVRDLLAWLASPLKTAPPNEKRFWWPLAVDDNGAYSRFERICWFWSRININIRMALLGIDSRRKRVVKLEDFLSSYTTFKETLAFIGVRAQPHMFSRAQRPVNTREPRSYDLTEEQEEIFSDMCGDVMDLFEYTGDYRVPYVHNDSSGKVRYSY